MHVQIRKSTLPRKNGCFASPKKILCGLVILSLLVILITPAPQQQVEAKKIKEKKILKAILKGLIVKNLSTKKNFLPLPVPIPVPIELNDPPVYIKGKPSYVTIYKPAPVPVYPSRYAHYVVNPYQESYASMLVPVRAVGYQKHVAYKEPSTGSSEHSSKRYKFNDFDDESGNYYLKKASQKKRGYNDRSDLIDLKSSIMILPNNEEESIDTEDSKVLSRSKRQTYESSYEKEPPCYGFPLEINIRSRIKLDQVFPIKGKSQFKKCIKIGKPLLPTVEDDSPYKYGK